MNVSYRIDNFSDEFLLSNSDVSSGILSGEILKVVSYFSAVTRKWPEKSSYIGPTLTRPQALVSIIRKGAEEVFKKEIVEAFVSITGVYPIGSILKLSDGNICVVVKRFKNFFEQSDVLVLDKNLSIKERRTVNAEDLLDIPAAAGIDLPEKTIVEILNTFLDERESSNETSK